MSRPAEDDDEDSTEQPGAFRFRTQLRAVKWDRIPLGTILVAVATVVTVCLLGKILYRFRELVLVTVVAGFVALLLNPLVLALQRWGIRRRGLAVAVVTFVSVVVFATIAYAFGAPLVRGLTHLANSMPTYVRRAEEGRGWYGHLVRRLHVETWVRHNSPKLVSFAESLSKPILSLGKGALSAVALLGMLFVLVLLLLLEAPRMRVSILGAMPPSSAERWRRLGGKISRASSGYMLGNLLTSLLTGLVAFLTLFLLSVPFALLWALWVALVDFLPEIGGALALIPTVLFAFTHSLTAGVVTAVVFVISWQFENRVLNPIVMSRTVKINPLLVFAAVILGASLGGWIGGTFGGFATALVAIPSAAAGQAIVSELRHRPDDAGTQPDTVRRATDLVTRNPE